MEPKDTSPDSSFTFENITKELEENKFFILPPNTNFDLKIQLPVDKNSSADNHSSQRNDDPKIGTFSINREISLGTMVYYERNKHIGLKLTNSDLIVTYQNLGKWLDELEIPSEYLSSNPFDETITDTNYDWFFEDHPELAKKRDLLLEDISILKTKLDTEFLRELGLEIPKDYSSLYLEIPLVEE